MFDLNNLTKALLCTNFCQLFSNYLPSNFTKNSQLFIVVGNFFIEKIHTHSKNMCLYLTCLPRQKEVIMSQNVYIWDEKWLKRLSNENFRYVTSLHPLTPRLTTIFLGFFYDYFRFNGDLFLDFSVNLMDFCETF